MEMTGECRIEASRETVWRGLNDPEVLKQSITGCEEIEQDEENHFNAKVTLKVGPVKAKFGGSVTLSDLDPPNSYKISGEGKGGAAGFAKGGAEVTLEPDGDATILHYKVSASVGGKLAQLGGRLIDSTARKFADEFFDKFKQQMEVDSDPVEDEQPDGVATQVTESEQSKGMSPGLWILLLIIIVAAVGAYFGLT